MSFGPTEWFQRSSTTCIISFWLHELQIFGWIACYTSENMDLEYWCRFLQENTFSANLKDVVAYVFHWRISNIWNNVVLYVISQDSLQHGWKDLILEHNSFHLKYVEEAAARTRAPTDTNYDVYAFRRKILESPSPKCNGGSSSRLSTFRITDTPRPGKWVLCLHRRAIFSHSLFRPSNAMGFLKPLSNTSCEFEVNRVEEILQEPRNHNLGRS